jgi:hypothetical protein
MFIAAAVFTLAYAMARLLSQRRLVAAAAAWILGFLAAPFVSVSFFIQYSYTRRTPGRSWSLQSSRFG